MSIDPLLLVVDDEAGILRLMKLELSAQGFRVITASDGESAITMAEEHRPDAILLDVMMPGISGLEVMRRLRERSNVPVLLVTAKDRDTDKVRGLELGADDYIVKPFNPDELGARVRAVLRRSINQDVERVITAGDVEIDLNRRLVKKGGEPVALTRTEWLLLQHLASNAGKVMLNTELLTKVWGPEYRDDLQYLRVWVSRLRAKLEVTPSSPLIIKTLQGIGYLFEADAEASEAAEGTVSAATDSAG
jgi:two-component system KDP operon response regulator KdpE